MNLFGRRADSRRNNPTHKRLGVETLESRHLLAGDSVVGLSEAEVEQKIDSFKSYFDTVMESEHASFLDLSIRTGTDGLHLYNLQFAVDGVLSMYEATGDRDVLDKAILYVTNVMESAETIAGGFYEHDGFLDWEVLSGNQPRPRREGLLLYDLQIGSAMSRLARILHEDVRLQDDPALPGFGDELTDFVDQQIVHKWLDARHIRGSLERFHDTTGTWTDTSTHLITICHNLDQVMANNSSCGGIHRNLAEQFQSLLTLQADGAYLWDIWAPLPAGHTHLAPDTAHENRTATMIAQLGADNFVFDEADILALGKTFTERIWNGRTNWENSPSVEESPWFHNYIDGSDESYRGYIHHRDGTEGMNGFVYDGWIRLGQFVPDVQLAGESLLAFIREFGWGVNASLQRNGSSFGKVALVGHLAKNLRFSEFATAPSASSAQDNRDVPVAPESTVPSLPGDADRDGAVGFADFLLLSASFGRNSQGWGNGDFDGDSVVGFADFIILAGSFGTILEQ